MSQKITGSIDFAGYGSDNTRIVGNGLGAFSKGSVDTSETTGAQQANSGNLYSATSVTFDSSRNTRAGTVTRGKRKGVKYIIKAL